MTDRVDKQVTLVDEPQVAVATPAVGRISTRPIPPRGFVLPKTFSALRHRNFRLFFTGQLISLIGTWMQNVAQAWLVYAITGSPLYLGVVSFASSIPVLTLMLGAGVFIDRLPKRTVLILTQSSAMVLAFILAADVVGGWVQAWHIVVLSFLLGAVNAFDAPARQAFVVEMVDDREDLMNAIALNAAAFNAARVIGPTLAGIALAAVGAAWCFFLNGVSFVAVIIGLWMMRVPPLVGAKPTESPVKQLREGLHYIWQHQAVRTVIALVAVANLFAFGYSSLMPAFAEDVLHSGPTGLGLLSAAVGVGALGGALMVASLGNYSQKGRLLTFGNLVFPTMVLLFSVSRWLPISMLFLVGAGFGFMIQNATANTLVQTFVPDELRGRVMSVYMMVFQGFFPLGALMAGAIAERATVVFGVASGISFGAAFGGCIALAYGLFLFWRAPLIRRLS